MFWFFDFIYLNGSQFFMNVFIKHNGNSFQFLPPWLHQFGTKWSKTESVFQVLPQVSQLAVIFNFFLLDDSLGKNRRLLLVCFAKHEYSATLISDFVICFIATSINKAQYVKPPLITDTSWKINRSSPNSDLMFCSYDMFFIVPYL